MVDGGCSSDAHDCLSIVLRALRDGLPRHTSTRCVYAVCVECVYRPLSFASFVHHNPIPTMLLIFVSSQTGGGPSPELLLR